LGSGPFPFHAVCLSAETLTLLALDFAIIFEGGVTAERHVYFVFFPDVQLLTAAMILATEFDVDWQLIGWQETGPWPSI
jgi:hypothetical protein